MIFASVKNAARAARRLHLALQEGGRYSFGHGVTIRRSEACDMIARSLGYRDYHHLVNAFGTVELHPNDVADRLLKAVDAVGSHLTLSDIVGEVIPTVREGAPAMDHIDWHYRREFVDLQQNREFEDALSALQPGSALLLVGASYTGKSRIAERHAKRMSEYDRNDLTGVTGMSFSLGTCGSAGDVADRLLRSLDEDHVYGRRVAIKMADLRARLEEMPARLIVLDDFDSIGIRKGKRSVEALDFVASLVSGSQHRWVIIGIDRDGEHRDGIERVIDRSPALRSLVSGRIDLPEHAGDDEDVARVMKAWERSLPIPCNGFFDHADHREEMMSILGAPISIGIVMNGLRDLGKKIKKTPSPQRADILALMVEMRDERASYQQRQDEWAASQVVRPKPMVRRHALVAVPHLLGLAPGRLGYDHNGDDVCWEVEAEGTKFTCRIKREVPSGDHSLQIDAVDIIHDEQTAGISSKEGVITLGVGQGIRALYVEFNPDVIPGWTGTDPERDHAALRAALQPMWKENRLDDADRSELRHLVRILRDATGAEGVGFCTSTPVSRQSLYCQMDIGSKVDVTEIAAILETDYPRSAWRYGGPYMGSIGSESISFWQEKPRPISTRQSIEERIRRNIPGCSSELRDAILRLHSSCSGQVAVA